MMQSMLKTHQIALTSTFYTHHIYTCTYILRTYIIYLGDTYIYTYTYMFGLEVFEKLCEDPLKTFSFHEYVGKSLK